MKQCKKISRGIWAGSTDCSFPTWEASSHLLTVSPHTEEDSEPGCQRLGLWTASLWVAGFATTNVNTHFQRQSPCLSCPCFSGIESRMVSEVLCVQGVRVSCTFYWLCWRVAVAIEKERPGTWVITAFVQVVKMHGSKTSPPKISLSLCFFYF